MAYYIVGSKYEYKLNLYEDVLPQIIKDNSLCVGFASELDLTRYYCQPEEVIVKHLKDNNEIPRSYNALKKYLNLREGDIVAIKSYCAPIGKKAHLVIGAIGIVTSRNGIIYKYEPQNYGHRINIEILEKDIKRVYEMGYGKTVHKLTNINHIKTLFNNQIDDSQATLLCNFQKGVINKNLDEQIRKINCEYIATAYHNRIQEKLYDELVSKYGSLAVKKEVGFIDVLVNANGESILFEVKPFESGKQCIRESIGQLLEYSWYKREYFDFEKIKLVIVGPKDLSVDEKKYFEYITNSLSCQLEYRVVE